MDLKNFHYIEKEQLQAICKIREGETKIGQKASLGAAWQNSSGSFVILGIEESIGVKANLGIAGTHTAWNSFLTAFSNVQSSLKLAGEDIHILGAFNFEELNKDLQSTEEYRKAVALIDDEVSPLIEAIVKSGKTPIIIGGSHANAYPIIKGCSLAKNQPLNIINLDAHADFRPLEGRHSGNPFSTARAEGYVDRYSVLGLHENYNSQSMLEEMRSQKKIDFYFWEDIYLRKKITFEEALNVFIMESQKSLCGIELDMDSIAGVLSSAKTPSGFSTTEARYYAYQCGNKLTPSYLHICEAAAELETGQKDNSSGKLLTYLVSDFIKGALER